MAAITGIHTLGVKSALSRRLKAARQLAQLHRSRVRYVGFWHALALLSMPLLLWSIGESFLLTINVGTTVWLEILILSVSFALAQATWKRVFYAWQRDGHKVQSLRRHTRSEFGLIAICAIAAFITCCMANHWFN